MACLQHGADPKYITLHAQTQKQLKYHLKHKYGTSTTLNSDLQESLWHGMGQGAGDACPTWVIGTNSTANAYVDKAQLWQILPPNSNIPVTQTIKAFINNTNLFISQLPNQSNNDFKQAAQMDTNQWHGLLQATGGELNIKKCFVFDVQFEYDQSGNLSFRPRNMDDPAITLTHTNRTREPLRYTKSNKGV